MLQPWNRGNIPRVTSNDLISTREDNQHIPNFNIGGKSNLQVDMATIDLNLLKHFKENYKDILHLKGKNEAMERNTETLHSLYKRNHEILNQNNVYNPKIW